MTIVINDIQYKNVKGFSVREVDKNLEVTFNDMALLIRDASNVVRVNEEEVIYKDSRELLDALLKEQTTEFEYKSFK